MTTAYTSLLGLALPVTGELSGTWGDTVNNSITSLLDSAIAGTTTLSSDADVTLTTTTGAANTSRQAILLWTAGGTVTRNITAPAQSKIYTVINKSSSTQSIVLRGVGPTTGVTIVKGESAVCAWNGSDFIKISNISGAGVFTTVTASSLTSGRVVYASTSGLLVDNSGFTYAGTNLALTTGDMTIGNGSSATTRMFRALEVGASGNTAGIAFGSGGVKGAVYGQSGSSTLSIVSGNSGAIAFGYATGSNDAGASANFNSLGTWSTTGLAVTGSLGVGTTNATYPLAVKTSTAGYGIAVVADAAQPNYAGIAFLQSNGSSQWGAVSVEQTDLRFYTGTTEGFRLTSTSLYTASGINVGIGTNSTSAYRLNVKAAFTSGVAGAYIEAGEFNQSIMVLNHTNAAVTSNLFQVQKSGTGVLTLDASGNLGVGTTSPSTGKFGDASCAVLVQSSDPAYGTNIFSSNSNNTKFVGFWSGHSSADSAVGVKSGTALTFGAWGAINGAGGFSERMRIDTSGNLLVGTTSANQNIRIGQKLGVVSTGSGTYGGVGISSYSGTSNVVAPVIDINRSRGTTDQSFTAVVADDYLGYIVFRGSDGTGFTDAAYIQGAVDGTVAANQVPARLAFYTANSAGTVIERARITSGGSFQLGAVNDGVVKSFTVYQGGGAEGTVYGTFIRTNGGSSSLEIQNVNDFFANAANAACRMGRNSVNVRSLNAGGTINAVGADYAEYMTKAGDFAFAKGDVVGIDSNGKLTNVFADAVSFMVKSTDPSYVGGDTWGVGFEDDAEGLEAARQRVDRIAFAGQVPVNVTGATAGQYIIPANDNGAIKGEAVSNPTFEQYQTAVGKVIAIESDGRAKIIVKVA